MAQDPTGLLAADALARSLGCGGLHPRLRAALEAGAAFPARRAGPPPMTDLAGPLPENVVRFPAVDLPAAREGAVR